MKNSVLWAGVILSVYSISNSGYSNSNAPFDYERTRLMNTIIDQVNKGVVVDSDFEVWGWIEWLNPENQRRFIVQRTLEYVHADKELKVDTAINNAYEALKTRIIQKLTSMEENDFINELKLKNESMEYISRTNAVERVRQNSNANKESKSVTSVRRNDNDSDLNNNGHENDLNNNGQNSEPIDINSQRFNSINNNYGRINNANIIARNDKDFRNNNRTFTESDNLVENQTLGEYLPRDNYVNTLNNENPLLGVKKIEPNRKRTNNLKHKKNNKQNYVENNNNMINTGTNDKLSSEIMGNKKNKYPHDNVERKKYLKDSYTRKRVENLNNKEDNYLLPNEIKNKEETSQRNALNSKYDRLGYQNENNELSNMKKDNYLSFGKINNLKEKEPLDSKKKPKGKKQENTLFNEVKKSNNEHENIFDNDLNDITSTSRKEQMNIKNLNAEQNNYFNEDNDLQQEKENLN